MNCFQNQIKWKEKVFGWNNDMNGTYLIRLKAGTLKYFPSLGPVLFRHTGWRVPSSCPDSRPD